MREAIRRKKQLNGGIERQTQNSVFTLESIMGVEWSNLTDIERQVLGKDFCEAVRARVFPLVEVTSYPMSGAQTYRFVKAGPTS